MYLLEKGSTGVEVSVRPEATGFGAVYFASEMLKLKNDSFKGKTIAISGFGNVAWGCAIKINELGGKVVTLSGPDGYIYDKDGIKGEKIEYMLEMRSSNNDRVEDYAKKFGVPSMPAKNRGKPGVILRCRAQRRTNSMKMT